MGVPYLTELEICRVLFFDVSSFLTPPQGGKWVDMSFFFPSMNVISIDEEYLMLKLSLYLELICCFDLAVNKANILYYVL